MIVRWGRLALVPFLLLALAGTAGAQSTGVPARTFTASLDRAWAVAESVLKGLGWSIDTSDRAVGWILTDSRGVDFKDFGVYGDGTRHKLRLTFKDVGGGQTAVSVERELYKEERILWMTNRKPLQPADQAVELGVLDALGRAL